MRSVRRASQRAIQPLARRRSAPARLAPLLPAQDSLGGASAADIDTFETFRTKAERNLQRFCGKSKEIDGRAFIHWDDYVGWEGCQVPGDLKAQDFKRNGLVISSWNSWLGDCTNRIPLKIPKSFYGMLDHPITARLEKPLFSDQKTVAQAAVELRARNKALDLALSLVISTFVGERESQVPTRLQLEILNVLNGNALTKEKLAFKLACDPGTLYKPGGIKELLKRGLVKNDRKVGGYYRPDCPPNSYPEEFQKKPQLSGD